MSLAPLFVICLLLMLTLQGCGTSEPPISRGKAPADWVEDLHSADVSVRIKAVKKLGNIGSKDPEALPAIYEALTDSSAAVRKEAIHAVVRTFPASRDALSTLEEMSTEDADQSIRSIAAEAHANLIGQK